MKTKNILVMSGKGGVGKTTIAVNLAQYLFQKGFAIGLLDVDLHGPNALKMLGFKDVRLGVVNEKLEPKIIDPRFKVASIAGFIDDNSALIWRGPRKHGAIKQLIEETDWGQLDYLVIDFPPGTGDEHISTAQLLKENSYSLIISTPQSVSIMDMKRAIDFCNQIKLPIIGVIENMSGDIFGKGTVEKECNLLNKKFLGALPLSKDINDSSEQGKPFFLAKDNPISATFDSIAKKIMEEIK